MEKTELLGLDTELRNDQRTDARRAKQIEAIKGLDQFTGTEKWYKHTLTGLLYTDGVQFFCEECEAYWLLDAIASYQGDQRISDLGIQFWELMVKNHKALLAVHEDMGMPNRIAQEFEYADLPDGEYKVWVADNVALLPSEY